MTELTRRHFLIASPVFLSSCVSTVPPAEKKPAISDLARQMYAAPVDEPYPVPAVDLSKIPAKLIRQEVDYPTSEVTGTIVVDTRSRFLYLVGENGRALRYGIGVGKAGLEFQGVAVVQYKREWPKWTPTKDMIAREPARYGPLASGMEPGVTNPLGARALYLFKNGEDTLFRIHGSNEAWSIGKAMSSGCIRLLNQDIIDLYRRVPNGSKVVVIQDGSQVASTPL